MQNRKSCLKWMCYGAAFCAMSVLAACDTVQFGDDDAASATTPVKIAKNPDTGGSNDKDRQNAPEPVKDGNTQPGTGGSNNNNADNSKSRDNQGDSNRGGGSNDKDRQNAPEPVKDGNTQPGTGGSNNNNADNSKSRDNQGDSNRGGGSNDKDRQNAPEPVKDGNTQPGTGGSNDKGRQNAPEPVKDGNTQPGTGGSNDKGRQNAPEPVKDGNTQPGTGGSNNNNADNSKSRDNQGDSNRGTGDDSTGGGDSNNKNTGNNNGGDNKGGNNRDTGGSDGKDRQDAPEPVKNDDESKKDNEGEDGDRGTGGRDDNGQPGNTGGSDDDDQTGNTDGNTGTDQTDATRKSSEPKKNAAQSTPEREKTFWKSTEKYAKEYEKSGAFTGSNAANGLPTGKIGGDGVIVGVIEGKGIDFTHPELKGTEAKENPNPLDPDEHPTLVAAVIAARRDGHGMHGVAPFAKLNDLSSKTRWVSQMLRTSTGNDREYPWAKSDIVNISLGVQVNDNGMQDGIWIPDMKMAAQGGVIMVIGLGNGHWTDKGLKQDKPAYPAAFVTRPGIKGFAIAAGMLDARNSKNPVHSSGSFCGEVIKHYCIYAPGVSITTAKMRDKYGPPGDPANYGTYSGSSVSAPVVSGYLANLMSAFPERRGQKWGHDGVYKNANWYVARLLSTAQDLGDKGVDKVYGVGMVDGTNMFLPQGTTSAVTSSGHFTMAQTQAIGDMRLGTGIANLGQAAALNQVLVYDEHRAPFLMNLQGRVERTQPSSSSYIADFVKRLSALDDEPAIAKQPIVAGMDMAFGFTLSQHQGLGKAYDTASLFDTAETPIALAATSDPLAFSMGTRTAMGAAVSLSDTMTLSFSASSNRKPDESPDPSDTTFLLTQDEADAHRAKLLGRLGLNYEGEYGAFQLQSGILHEKKGLFDTTGSDALAFARDARASYVQLGARIPLTDRIDLLGSYTQGWAAVDEAGESMWRGHEDMRFNAFTLGASYKGLFDTTDKLSFTVGQPLRLTSGSVYLRKAPGERNGAAYLVDAPVDLSPEDRELMFQLAYQVDIARRARLSLGGYYRINPGHDKRQPDDFGIGAKFSMRF